MGDQQYDPKIFLEKGNRKIKINYEKTGWKATHTVNYLEERGRDNILCQNLLYLIILNSIRLYVEIVKYVYYVNDVQSNEI